MAHLKFAYIYKANIKFHLDSEKKKINAISREKGGGGGGGGNGEENILGHHLPRLGTYTVH